MKFALGLFFLAFQFLGQTAFCAGHAFVKQSEPSKKPEAAGRLPRPGYRSMGLEFDNDLISYISPEDRVDVITVIKELQFPEKAGVFAATLLKMVRVLAVEASASDPGKSVVRFELNPNEAQYLELASRSGAIRLSLRKKGDVEDAPMQAVSWKKFLKPGFEPVSRAGAACAGAEAAAWKGAAGPDWGSAGRKAVLDSIQDRMKGEAYVALSFPVAADKARSVREGDRIDILATLDTNETGQQRAQKTTLTLLQNIRVLDLKRSGTLPGQSVVLLEMNFNEAQFAALAWESADVQVLLRDPKDEEVHSMEQASLTFLSR